MSTELEVLQKWGNGVANRNISLGQVFQFCKDVMISLTDESEWQSPEPVILEAGQGSTYDHLALKYERLDESVETESIWIYSLARNGNEAEYRITSSICLERDFRKGSERFQAFTPPPEDYYIDLLMTNPLEDSLMSLPMKAKERKTLFLAVKSGFMATVLANNESATA